MLSGVLSPEDEESVEAELNELISSEHQQIIDMLPTIPSDDLPVTVQGSIQHYTIMYYILKHVCII